MAATRLPKPGSEFGPCEEACEHIDCAETRKMANMLCAYCERPLGYEVPVFFRDAKFGSDCTHERCEIDALPVRREA